jgi:hypothetical protein
MGIAALALTLSACGEMAKLPVSAGTGPQPTLPSPEQTLIPTVNIAPAKGWPPGAAPQAATGLRVIAVCVAQRRCPGGGEQCPAEAR